ncbi:sensor histidine kinase [Evansella tamaricis]|uniref:histidine kinase n=1 Tax=Evansella tamaricis TaxID=2069301 RepID=A0ABS6JH13_9BACI|nr:histidine kinase [Evansella tamaricis]MBU9712901.1 hypothetical protein [Evansella tamaricis]
MGKNLWSFLGRFLLLLCIWVLILVDSSENMLSNAVFLLLLSGFFLFYFLRPLFRVKLYIHIIMLTFHTVIQYFILHNQFTGLFIYYFILVELIFLKEKEGRKLVLSTIAASMIPFLVPENWSTQLPILLHHILLIIFFGLAVWLTDKIQERLMEKEYLYDELIKEYRLLKRQAVQVENSARAEERTRVARDMHDSVGHKLTALMMQLEILERTVEDGKGGIKEAKKMAKESLMETRSAVKALNKGEVAGMSSVIQLIRKLEVESHIRVNLTTKEGVLSAPLTNLQNVVVYRFIQEGLTNAMRHAQSREVTMILELLGNHTMKMTVTNKIHVLKPFMEGFGLSEMRKRFEGVKGKLYAHQTEKTFYLIGTFPLRKGEQVNEKDLASGRPAFGETRIENDD